MSRTFSIKSGSLDSLKVVARWGCSAKARQIRLTVLWLSPAFAAIPRVLQCVASRGVVSRVRVRTRSTSSSSTHRGAPGRASSSKLIAGHRYKPYLVTQLQTQDTRSPAPAAVDVPGHEGCRREKWPANHPSDIRRQLP